VESNWPIDPAAQAELITLLNEDAAIPPPEPVVAGSFYLETLEQLNDSTKRAQQIVDKLKKAQADADNGIGAVAPLPAQATTGGYALDEAVTNWLKAQGLQVSGNDWSQATYLDGTHYVSFSRELLTQPTWSFPVPGVVWNPVSDDTYITKDDGSIQRGEVLPHVVGLTVAELEANGYDTTFIPDIQFTELGQVGTMPFPTDTAGVTVTPIKVGNTIYATISRDTIARLTTAQPSYEAYFAASYGPIMPLPLGVPSTDGSLRDTFYRSDGAVVYRIDASDLARADFSAPAGTVSQLNTGPKLATYLARKGVIEPVDRLMEESDEGAVSLQLEGRTKTITSIVNQWANTADAENLRLKSTYNEYSVAMTMLTNIIEKMSQALNGLIPR